MEKYIKENTLRCEVSYRGGGIEIDAEEFLGIDGARVSVYQNYLGGGLLGSVCSANNLIENNLGKKEIAKLETLENTLKEYYHNLTNPLHDEDWEQTSYEENQTRPISAY